MKLTDYLDSNGLSDADFARAIGVSANAVRHYKMRRRLPRPEIMDRIRSQTLDAVMPNDFYSDNPSSSNQELSSA